MGHAEKHLLCMRVKQPHVADKAEGLVVDVSSLPGEALAVCVTNVLLAESSVQESQQRCDRAALSVTYHLNNYS